MMVLEPFSKTNNPVIMDHRFQPELTSGRLFLGAIALLFFTSVVK